MVARATVLARRLLYYWAKTDSFEASVEDCFTIGIQKLSGRAIVTRLTVAVFIHMSRLGFKREQVLDY